jgi:hypothetical protein
MTRYHHPLLLLSVVAVLLLTGTPVRSEDSPPAGTELLGPPFQSYAAGIAFRPPAGSKQITRGGISDEIVQFIQDEKKWMLKVSQIQLREPAPLVAKPDKDNPTGIGLLDATAERLKADIAGLQILRNDVIHVGDAEVGMITSRYTQNLSSILSQKALVRGGPRLYYLFDLTSPAPHDGTMDADPNVRQAVETFSAVLESIRLIDRSALKQDQDDRLYRTRALMTGFSEPNLRKALVPEQWLRLIRDGKDFGYLYIVEEVARDLPRAGARTERAAGPEGVLVGIRSRSFPEPQVKVDAESWMFVTFDRRTEHWATQAVVEQPGGVRDSTSELGVSMRRIRAVKDANVTEGPNRGMSTTEEHFLEVTRFTRAVSSEPVRRDLPPFYLPMAMGHLLPRLVPLDQPKTYLFASYESESQQVALRYIDVGRETEVTLDGKRQRAVPISDRIGLEGAPNIHYMSPDGKYLGSVNEQAGVTMLPSDARSIEALWKDAILTRPADVDPARNLAPR